MQNSDSGTRLNPGDRVRVRHKPELDGAYSKAGRASRAALNGQTCEVIEVDAPTVHVRGADDDAWFEPNELGPVEPLDVLDAAVQQALAAARREAQGWHSAALLARGEAEGTRERLAEVEAERDALRGKLGAAEGKLAVVAQAFRVMRAAWNEISTDAGPVGEVVEGMRAIDAALGGVEVPRCAYCANPPANGLSVCLDHGKSCKSCRARSRERATQEREPAST